MNDINQSQKLSNISTTTVFICIIAPLFYIFEYLVRVLPSAISTQLMQHYHITAAGLGMLTSLFFWGYAIMQIPSGMLYDRFGARKILGSMLLICTLSTFLFAATRHLPLALVSRFLMGFSGSFAYVGALYVGVRALPPRYFATYAGLVQFFGCIGAIIGQGPVVWLSQHFGWRSAVYIIANMGILFTALTWLVLKNNHTAKPIKNHSTSKSTEPKLAHPLRQSQTWVLAFYGFCIWAPITSFAVLWGIPFLQVYHHETYIDAANQISLIWIGIAIGGPFFGWLSDKIGQRKLPMIIASFMGTIASLIVIYNTHLPQFIITMMLFVFGAASSTQLISFATARDFIHTKHMGIVIGFINMAVILGGMTIQPMIGFIIQHNWTGQMINHTPAYTAHDYQTALIVVPISFFFALLTSAFFIKETNCSVKYSSE